MFDKLQSPNKKYILIVCEGSGYEQVIINSVKNLYFTNDLSEIVFISYNTNIYQLYQSIKQEDYPLGIDIFEFIKERDANTEENKMGRMLKEQGVSDIVLFERIYLFFDYDGQTCKERFDTKILADDAIFELLEYFNNETENGRLFISYPMSEAIVDFSVCTSVINKKHDLCCLFSAREKTDANNNSYKKRIGDKRRNYKKKAISCDEFEKAFDIFLKRLHFLLYNTYGVIGRDDFDSVDSIIIHRKQKELFIDKCESVFILSAFPYFVLYHFGYDTIIPSK